MSRSPTVLIIASLILSNTVSWANAQNNKVGVHILQTNEIFPAAKLVNSNGGDWGYVTIPIQSDDKSFPKWQLFLNECKKLHIIPILRLATRPDANGYWETPTFDDIVDFSNFLSDLSWPTRNKHVIVFNEPNRHAEFGGRVDPEKYAYLLSFAIDRFKSLDQDFVVLPAALDAALATTPTSMTLAQFSARMYSAVPTLPSRLDGINSHAYPNPAFSGRPTDTHKASIISYRYDRAILRKYTNKNFPVYITETGWQMTSIPEEKVAVYYQQAYESAWKDPAITAVTPFLLYASEGEFAKFSLLNRQGQLRDPGKILAQLPKIAGNPQLPLTPTPSKIPTPDSVPASTSKTKDLTKITNFFSRWSRPLLKIITNRQTIRINGQAITVEVADTAPERERGLSGRDALATNRGMLFVFTTPGVYPFWMKEMKFPLDFIWIRNNQVVDLSSNIPAPESPTDNPISIIPKSVVDRVIEVNAGFIEKYNISIGDKVES